MIKDNMKIELKKSPRYKNAPDSACIIYLVVNGYTIGTYYGGEKKQYENPEKWAREQLPKRIKTLKNAVTRHTRELELAQKELDALEQ